MISFERNVLAALGLVICTFLSGCGTPGAPQPPSLLLADPVNDLTATRTGNKVTLNWTMPKRNTDKTAVKPGVVARICRLSGAETCRPVADDDQVTPGKQASFTETLPDALASGDARPVSYAIELLNKKGRSAGLSNAAIVLVGAAPGSIEGLKAEVRKQGVVLSWNSAGDAVPVRLVRRLLTALPPKAQKEVALAPPPEPMVQTMLVESGLDQGRTIDTTARFNESYEYRAQRVARVQVDGKTLELAGELSAPIDVDVKDVFPPQVPTGLAAVATAGGNGGEPAIDLSWQPVAETDFAGYVVYRREGDGEWQRISAANPSLEPAFHDGQVQPGHTYRYAVSAVDNGGHESARSAEAEETVPQN